MMKALACLWEFPAEIWVSGWRITTYLNMSLVIGEEKVLDVDTWQL